MIQLLLLGDLPPERHNSFNCIDPLFNGSPDETTWSLLDRVCMPMLPNDNTISVRTDPRSSYRPSGHNPKNCIAIQTKPEGKTRSPNLFVPSILLSNVMSLAPKIDELCEVSKQIDVDLFCITELWLQNHIHDNVVEISGYNIVRRDRYQGEHGGVEARFVNCGIIILGDLNKLNLSRLKNSFKLCQIVKFPTRGASSLDLVLTNMKQFYDEPTKRPPFGLSDHLSVEIQPLKRPTNQKVIAAKILCEQIPAFSFLKTVVSNTYPSLKYAAELKGKSTIVPFPVLLKDEKKYADIVDVLDQLETWVHEIYVKAGQIPDSDGSVDYETSLTVGPTQGLSESTSRPDQPLSHVHPVADPNDPLANVRVPCYGDQLTRVRMAGAKDLRAGCHRARDRFNHIHPIKVADWHSKQNFLKVSKNYYVKMS